MNTKLKLSVCLFLFCASLVFVPEISIYAVFLNGISTTVAIAAIVSFIIFLQSRKPAEKTVINRLLHLNFYFKLMLCLYYYLMTCIGYSSQTHPNYLEKVLSSTMLSHISVKTVGTLNVMFYVFISMSRTCLFVSPGIFRSLNVWFVQWVAIAMLLAYFVAEIVYFQVLFHSEYCEVDQFGNGIHSFAFEVFLKSRAQIAEGLTKRCNVMAAVMPLCVILVAIESIRVIAATVRELKKSRKKARVSPDFLVASYTKRIKIQENQSKTIKKTSRSNSVPLSTECRVKLSDEVRRLSLQNSCIKKAEIKLNTNHHIKLNEKSTLRILVDLIYNLVKRTYSLVVFLMALVLFCFILPISFLGMDRLEIMYKVAKLDILFVPVFWLLIDKDVLQYTKKILKESFMSIKMRFL